MRLPHRLIFQNYLIQARIKLVNVSLLVGQLPVSLLQLAMQEIIVFLQLGVVLVNGVDLPIVCLDNPGNLILLFLSQLFKTLDFLGVIVLVGALGLVHQTFAFLLQLFLVPLQRFNLLLVLEDQTLHDLVLLGVDSDEVAPDILLHLLLLLQGFLADLLVLELTALRHELVYAVGSLSQLDLALLDLLLLDLRHQFCIGLLQPIHRGF
jgi:hypothetical protein